MHIRYVSQNIALYDRSWGFGREQVLCLLVEDRSKTIDPQTLVSFAQKTGRNSTLLPTDYQVSYTHFSAVLLLPADMHPYICNLAVPQTQDYL